MNPKAQIVGSRTIEAATNGPNSVLDSTNAKDDARHLLAPK